ncbi:MAG TPA: ABC transporter ATP-binding protein [Pirellulales bacterium]|jgi:ATP-binding cassette subfamily B protein/subfamily B ATP-binding cassette protein MsbA
MNNFGRALRLSLRYRWTFAASVVCALGVAVMWGGSISALYPFIAVALEGKSLQTWAENDTARTTKAIATLEEKLAEFDRKEAAHTASAKDVKEHRNDENQLVAQQRALARTEWIRDKIILPYMPTDAFLTVVVIAGMLLVSTIVKCVLLIINSMLVARMVQLTTFDLTKKFYRHTLRMDLANFSTEGASDLMSRFTYDMECLGNGMRELFGKFVREPLKMIACLVGAAWISWQLLLLSLLLAPVAGITINALSKALKRANRRAMEEMSQIYNTLDETLQGIKVVKAFTMERHERRRFHVISKKFYRKSMHIARYDSLTRPLTEMLGISTICVALLAGAYLGINQQTHLFGIKMSEKPLTIEPLIVFFGLLAGASDPARKLSEVFSRLQRASAAAERVYQLIDRQPQIVDPVDPRALPRHTRELVFDQVNFHYQPTQPVLQDINLRIAWGETIAIVGPNGCGKSTLANLILRFYDPVSGHVRLDGVDLRAGRLADLRGQIGLVTQETLLFDDTVFNNIRYGSMRATREEVIEAAQRAHAHRFIETKLEHGYDTVVGPRGSLLSGGQRQRIALARAILRDPSILILDEATSQVDLESEQLIHKVLEQFVRGRTTVVITHRMSTLALADRIVVMSGGRILDVGTHDELLLRSELYSRLYSIQFKETA